MYRSFLLLRPEVCTQTCIDLALKFLEAADVRVDDVAILPAHEARRHRWLDRHYAAHKLFAFADSAQLSELIGQRPEVKSAFFAAFGELWDAVLAEGRLCSAKDAMVALGDAAHALSARQLAQRWWGNGDFQPVGSDAAQRCAPVELFRGLSVLRLAPENNLYVINGFLPAVLEACGPAHDGTVCRLSVSWEAARYSWAEFLTDVIGGPLEHHCCSRRAAGDAAGLPSNELALATSSLLYAIYSHADALGLTMTKDAWASPARLDSAAVVLRALEVANGPLEAFYWRCVWAHCSAQEDDFGRQLLRAGLPLRFVRGLLSGCTLMGQTGRVQAVFDYTAGLTDAQAVAALSELYVAWKLQQEDEESGCSEEGGLFLLNLAACAGAEDAAQSDFQPHNSSSRDRGEAVLSRSSAVVVLKPHAHTSPCIELLESMLARETAAHGLSVDQVVDLDAAIVAKKHMVERSYGAEYWGSGADASTELAAVSEDAQNAFAEAYGVPWQDALRERRVLSTAAAMHLLGGLSPLQLHQLWDAEERANRCVQLQAGVRVCRAGAVGAAADAVGCYFVLNGFVPYLTETFTAPGAVTRCYAVSWPEHQAPDALASVDLATSLTDGFLCSLTARWSSLGLAHAPDAVNSGVVVSRGPVQAAVQRHVWLGTPLDEDPLYHHCLRQRGVSAAALMQWLSNPVVERASGQRLFDALAGKSSKDIACIACDVDEQLAGQAACARADRTNRAVVLLHPSAATAASIRVVKETLAARAGAVVLAEGDVFGQGVAARMAADDRFSPAAVRLAALTGEPLWVAAGEAARAEFARVYGCSWAESTDHVMGASVACAALGLSPSELLRKWVSAEVAVLSPDCHVAHLPPYGAYVVNGLAPYLTGRYGSPGARVHYLDVEWPEARCSWAALCESVVGTEDIAAAAAGSLQRILAERWKEMGLAERPCHAEQCSVTVSSGPLRAVADRLRWVHGSSSGAASGVETAESRLLSDVFVQRLVAEGVPAGTVAFYVAAAAGTTADSQDHALCEEMSVRRQTSECVRHVKTVSARVSSAYTQQYGFLVIHPSCATAEFAAAIPQLLASHRVLVRSHGELPVTAAHAASLLSRSLAPLHRNAWVHSAAQLAVAPAEQQQFRDCFGLTWETAVRLSVVLNAREAVERYGEACVLRWWEEAPKKACLSNDLYVAYVELEGVYIVNGFYPYVRSRLYSAGCSGRALWFSVCWDEAEMSWEAFLSTVVGAADPQRAAPGSLRHHVLDKWSRYGFAGPPDLLDSGLHAAESTLEAAAERCLWWGTDPTEDVVGRLLLQRGVDKNFLAQVLRNPLVVARDSSSSSSSSDGCAASSALPAGVMPAFSLLPSSLSQLLHSLRRWQSDTAVALLPQDGCVLTPLPAQPAKEQEERLAQHLIHCAAAYQSLPVTQLPGDGSDHGSASAPPTTAYGVLAFSPATLSSAIPAAAGDLPCSVRALVRDHLRDAGVRIAYEGALSRRDASLRRIFDEEHRSLLRYALHGTASDLLALPVYQQRLQEMLHGCDEAGASDGSHACSIAWDPATVAAYNAAEAVEAFGMTPKRVNELWEQCRPVVRAGSDLFVGKVPDEDVYLVNGFVMHCQSRFYDSSQEELCFLLVEWDESRLSFADFANEVVGSAYLAEAAAGSLHGILRDHWEALGLPCAPHPYIGLVSASDSALAALRLRQLWLPATTSLRQDPLVRRALQDGSVSPFVLEWAMSSPPSDADGAYALGQRLGCEADAAAGTPHHLMGLLRGQGTDLTLQLLHALEENYREQQHQLGAVRNTAFLLVKPHALGRRFTAAIEAVLAKHRIRVNLEGDTAGDVVRDRGLLRVFYPAAAFYAVRPPEELALSQAEVARVEHTIGVSWTALLATRARGSRAGAGEEPAPALCNAYESLERLGGLTPQQLYVLWRVSQRRVRVRPQLELTVLDGPGSRLCVVNGFLPALKQSFEAPSALLHWYVVSWPEADMSWERFAVDVVGAADPAQAHPDSIRGQLQRHWADYGLHASPDHIQNGIHASSGPWHAMMERLRVVQPHLERDVLGDLLLRRHVHRGLLTEWLTNPQITACGITAGVVEHLAGYDTTQVVDQLAAISAGLDAAVQARSGSEEEAYVPGSASTSSTALRHPPLQLEHAGSTSHPEETAKDRVPAEEESVTLSVVDMHRNVGLLILTPFITVSPDALALLRAQLQQQRIRVVSESHSDITTAAAERLVDRMYPLDSFCAEHSAAAAVAVCAELQQSSFHEAFKEAYGESWDAVAGTTTASAAADMDVAGASQLVSAAEAMRTYKLTAEDLYHAERGDSSSGSCSGAARLHVGRGITLTKLTVGPGAAAAAGAQSSARSIVVLNASYPHWRRCLLQSPSSPEPTRPSVCTMRVMVVAWDGRQRSWRSFCDDVIGSGDPTCAAAGSFLGQLFRRWQALRLPAAPSLSNSGGLCVSDSALQAFAHRATWFNGTVSLLPDALLRSFRAAELDETQLREWRGNPLVEYSGTAADPARGVLRLFDLLHGASTSNVIALAQAVEHAEKCGDRPVLRILAPGCDEAASAVDEDAAVRGRSNTSSAAGLAMPAVNTSLSAPTAAAAGANPRQRLLSAKVQDALLHARSAQDMQRLWEHYLAQEIDAASRGTTASNTIDSALFRRDFACLETFGAPLSRHQVDKLFASATARGGRMLYEEFAHALATYQAM